MRFECGKRTFKSPNQAKHALRLLRSRGGPSRWYRCSECHGIHVASGR